MRIWFPQQRGLGHKPSEPGSVEEGDAAVCRQGGDRRGCPEGEKEREQKDRNV